MPFNPIRWNRSFSSLCLVTFALISGLVLPRPAVAQPTSNSPAALSGIAKRLASGKINSGATAASGATRFTPSGKRIYVAKMVDSLAENAEQKKALTDLFENALTTFDAEVKKVGMANDMVPALAFYIQTLWTVQSGKTVSEENGDRLISQLRGALSYPEIAGMSDSEKQSLYEYGVCMSTLTLTLHQAAEGKPDQMRTLRSFARESLSKIVGVDADRISIGAKGLEVSGTTTASGEEKNSASGTPPTGNLPRVTFTAPPDSRVENRGPITMIWRPKYNGAVKNDNEQLYYTVLPPVKASSHPDREAAFEADWSSLTQGLNVTWQGRTLVSRYYLPSGVVCYVAQGIQKANQTLGSYGSHDGTRMILCLLDFGTYYVSVAEVYSYKNGTDFLERQQAPFEDFIKTVRIPGATAPRSYVSREQVVGTWAHFDGYYSATDYYSSSTGAYSGSVIQSNSSRTVLYLNANGTAKFEFIVFNNGRVMTEIWDATWTLNKGILTLKNPKSGKERNYVLVYNGKHPKTGERFLALHYIYGEGKKVTTMSVNSGDTELFAPFKPK